MADPAPLVQLQPGGSPAIISYQVPEPMSFSGRNFIDLALPKDAFTPIENTASQDLPGPATLSRGSSQGTDVGEDASPDPQPVRDGLPPDVQAVETLSMPGMVTPNLTDADDATVVATTTAPLTERLARLTRGEVKALAENGQRVIIHPAVGGLLDFRVVAAPVASQTLSAGLAAGTRTRSAALRASDSMDEPGGLDPDPKWEPTLTVFLTTPQSGGPPITGPSAGAVVKVTGRWTSTALTATPTITAALDGQAVGPVAVNASTKTYSLDVLVAQADAHTLTVTGTASAPNSEGLRVQLTTTRTATITVELSGTGKPTTPPIVAITDPKDGTLLLSQAGTVTVTVSGTSAAGTGRTVAKVTLREGANEYTATPDTSGSWSIEIPLSGTGAHTITATATDDQGLSGIAATRAVHLSDQQPFRRLVNRLLIVETLNLSAFLGSFGAGRVIKTYSLLPGESATISVKSYTKSTEERKSASSIVDSNATDSATDFEDCLSSEQSNTEALEEASKYKVGASVSAGWGWGSASINAEFGGSANAARQEAVKNVSNATRKHSLKASTNRNITVNTEYQVQTETGQEESTVRTISNINVSRTLNFVFRQMNQQHITIIHLTNVRVAHYCENLMLDAAGMPAFRTDPVTKAKVLDIRPQYREVPLPELRTMLDRFITEDFRDQVRQDILHALSGIPDYQDQLKTAFEFVVPKDDHGIDVPAATYMQFPRGLSTTVTDPTQSGADFTVPGIVLGVDVITMRTEGVLVDAVLGPGDGLDQYSKQLQEVALAERQVAVAERQAEVDRLALACKIATDKDEKAAAVFAKLFPPPLAGTTVTTTTTSDGAGSPR